MTHVEAYNIIGQYENVSQCDAKAPAEHYNIGAEERWVDTAFSADLSV